MVWSSVLLPGGLTQLHRRQPSARFTILRSSGPRFAELFADGEIDLPLGALDAFAADDDSLACEPLSKIEMSRAASNGSLSFGYASASPCNRSVSPVSVFFASAMKMSTSADATRDGLRRLGSIMVI